MTYGKVQRGTAGLLALVALVLIACGGGESSRVSAESGETPSAGGLAVVCTPADPESLNPFASPDQIALDMLPLLYTPLVSYDEAGGFRPYLAARWEWGDEGRQLTFYIRSDVRWHDGRPLTAEDVAWTIRAAADPEYLYWNAGDFSGVEAVVVRDPLTVNVQFAESPGAGLEIFVGLPILPRHLLADIPAAEFAQADYHRSPVGSGPYEFSTRTPDGSIVLDRADSIPAALASPLLDRIVFRTITESTAIVAELHSGGADLCVTGSDVAEQVQGSERLKMIPLEPPQIQAIVLNTLHEPLDDARVRRALSAAIDRTQMAAAASPVARPAGSLLPESSPWIEMGLRQPDNDLALAESLLESAGWTAANEGEVRRDSQGRELRLTLLAPQQLRNALTVIDAQLGRVGVAVDLQFLEWATYVGTIINPETRPDAMALGFVPEKVAHPDFSGTYHSTSGRNVSSYSDPELDRVLERLRVASEVAELQNLYSELQRRVVEDVPIIYTVYVPRLLVLGPRVRDVTVSLNGPYATAPGWWIPVSERRARR